MLCNKCYESSIELKYTKDRETGFRSNYWWCEKCDSRTTPMRVYSEVDFTVDKHTAYPVESMELPKGYEIDLNKLKGT